MMGTGISKYSFVTLVWRVIALHMITYLVAGMIFSTIFSYRQLYSQGSLSGLMKDFNSPWIAAGPGLQWIRGALYAAVIWPFRIYFFENKNGWLYLWLLFLGFAIFGTAGPSPGSLEGMIYTKISFREQLIGLPEVVLQTGAFSWLLVRWYQHPKKWLNILAGITICLIILMSLAGVFLK